MNKNNQSIGKVREIIQLRSNFLKGELIGAFAGDGSYYHDTHGRSSKHLIRYHLSFKDDQEYGDYLISKLEETGLKAKKVGKKEKNGITSLEIRTCSVRFLEFIKNNLVWGGKKTYTVRLKQDLKEYNKGFLLGFARGLMDTDGFVDASAIACECTSKKLMLNLKEIFEMIGIIPTFRIRKRKDRRDIYRVRIKKRDLNNYKRNIGFSNPRKNRALLRILEGSSKVY